MAKSKLRVEVNKILGNSLISNCKKWPPRFVKLCLQLNKNNKLPIVHKLPN